MKTPKSLRRTAATVSTVAVLSLLAAFPASAATPGGGSTNPLQGLMDWFNEQLSSVQKYADSFLKDQMEAISKTFGQEFAGVTKDITGALGLPDPSEARKKATEASLGSENPLYSGEQVANEVDRQSTKASAAAILSQEGQEQQKTAYEQSQQSVASVGQAAEKAQGENVTQNVMKQIATQNAETAKLMGGVQSSLLKQNEQQAQANTQLTNISRTMDGQTKAQNAERVGAGYGNFGVASQAGLF
jgi:hypothetical protein